ncbi:hypothetical protein CA54_58160 [Symmachiella macrocystis]|uniref:DUF2383 domain-containing protein n=1 Tax=Symmachiella macrocystis TaxID=2527985 RepID=A0A5C6AZQ0_9PLAN|nr:hypothetical protein [Symmachiella macrocystis]TWU05128.1 hypothetical protein CA54_58160 [Symmachiella macrocystis]
MNDTRLNIYLNDHLALMVGEIDVAARCASSNRGTPLGDFLHRLEVEVEAQKSIVSNLIRRVGGTESSVKKGAMWLAEKLGRFKLNDSLLSYSDLSRVIELEALAAAAQERVALWDTMNAVVTSDERFAGITFSFFLDQSQQHLNEICTRRRYAATQAFS